MITMKHFVYGAFFGVVSVIATSQEARSQNSPYFQVRPGLTLQQYAYNTAAVGRALQQSQAYGLAANPYAQLANLNAQAAANPYASLYSNPYAANAFNSAPSAGYYGNPYSPYVTYSTPYAVYGETLHGSAAVVDAQGRFMVSQQQAYLMREHVRSERISNRRKMFDELMYEKEKTPTAEELRQRFLAEQVDRSRNNPPLTEVWSGKALNDLMMDLRKTANKNEAILRTFPINLDQEILKKINLSKGSGNIGLLRNEGRLSWPVALSGSDFKDVRDRLNALAREAVSDATFNRQPDAGTIKQMLADVEDLRKQLRKVGSDLPVALYIEANAFVNNLGDAIRALQQSDVGGFFTGRYTLFDANGAARAKTVPELVKFMANNGLQFAGATTGDENAYVALHLALVAYDQAAHPAAASPAGEKN